MSKKIKFGICQWSLPVEGPAACKVARELGFQGMQIDLGPENLGFPLSIPYVQELYLQAAKKHNIKLTSLSIRLFDVKGMTREDGTPEKETVMEAIEKAVLAGKNMEIPLIMMGSFEDGEILSERDLKETAKCLAYACDLAYGSDMTIASENLLSSEDMLRLNELVNRKNFGLYFDTQNYSLRKGYQTKQLIKDLHHLIHEVHVKDGSNGIMSGSLLGEGDSNFFETIEELKNVGYQGWINLENYYTTRPLLDHSLNWKELIKKDINLLKTLIENE